MTVSESYKSKTLLVHPSYFAPIAQYACIERAKNVVFECFDNYQKQTFRNRCYIYSPNGKQMLNIPILHTKGTKQRTSQVKIDNKYNWQSLHFKSLETSYRSSPFYEFYIDELMPVFERKWNYLIDLNLFTHECIMDALELNVPYTRTEHYINDHQMHDKRELVVAKNLKFLGLKPYFQLFEDRYGFIENLSILDLLFMQGPNATLYLEQQQIL